MATLVDRVDVARSQYDDALATVELVLNSGQTTSFDDTWWSSSSGSVVGLPVFIRGTTFKCHPGHVAGTFSQPPRPPTRSQGVAPTSA